MQSFPQSVVGIEIEDRLNLGRRFIREVDESSAARYGHQLGCGALFYLELDKVERVMNGLDESARRRAVPVGLPSRLSTTTERSTAAARNGYVPCPVAGYAGATGGQPAGPREATRGYPNRREIVCLLVCRSRYILLSY